jgi:parallel beta-helix repeat protein
VDDDAPPGWYDATHVKTIQEAIKYASRFDTVFVYKGHYYGKIVVNKQINLIGEDKNNTIIEGTGGSVIQLLGANSTVLDSFTIIHGSYHGIQLTYSANCIITNCISHSNEVGIYLETSRHNLITNCLVYDNSWMGIGVFNSSSDNLIYHNNFWNNNFNARKSFFNDWDKGYPTGGNYWDDYIGVDNFHGPNQNIPGSDGIGDTPYPISGSSDMDNYPYMTLNGWQKPPVLNISIDIKPGSYPNSINLKSKGKVPVAIFTTNDFDATNVDHDTIMFLDANPVHSALEDIDDDGDIDMIFHFKTQELDFSLLVDEREEYPYAYLTGETILGELIEGKDTVRLVGQYTFLQYIFEKLINRFPLFEKILNQI